MEIEKYMRFYMEEVKVKKMYRLRYQEFTEPQKPSFKYDVFTLPEGMTEEDAFQVLSYLFDKVEDLYACSRNSEILVSTVNLFLNLYCHFKREKNIDDEYSVIELFVFQNRESKIAYNRNNNSYFDWYIPNVTKEMVEAIYEKLPVKKKENSLKLTYK